MVVIDVLEPILRGFFLSLSLIVAIGAQNAFVIRQGLIGRHVFWLCAFCAVSDAVLIGLGVFTFTSATELWEDLPHYLAIVGAIFLFVYGALRFRAAYLKDYKFLDAADVQSLSAVIATAAVLTWANPHVYLDTFGLIGAISAGYADAAKIQFAVGAVSASVFFFFSLGYGARFLAPAFSSAKAWRNFDIAVGLIMWWIAVTLLVEFA